MANPTASSRVFSNLSGGRLVPSCPKSSSADSARLLLLLVLRVSVAVPDRFDSSLTPSKSRVDRQLRSSPGSDSDSDTGSGSVSVNNSTSETPPKKSVNRVSLRGRLNKSLRTPGVECITLYENVSKRSCKVAFEVLLIPSRKVKTW